MVEGAHWTPPDWDTREDRALRRLSLAAPPRGIVVPPALWQAAAWESGLTVLGVKRLAKRAAAGGDPRVQWYAAHLERLRRRTPRGPTDLTRGRMADWLRRRGLSWRRVALALGYASAHGARKAAKLYRARLASGDTLRRARLAYLRRERSGEPWARVARRVGYASDRAARGMARRYAKRAGRPWPVPLGDAPSANLVHEVSNRCASEGLIKLHLS